MTTEKEFANFVLRFEFGYRLFKFFGDQVTIFLDYTDSGCKITFN